jgi:hypothetical protein
LARPILVLNERTRNNRKIIKGGIGGLPTPIVDPINVKRNRNKVIIRIIMTAPR